MTRALVAIDGSEPSFEAARRGCGVLPTDAEWVFLAVSPEYSLGVALAAQSELDIAPGQMKSATGQMSMPAAPTPQSTGDTIEGLHQHFVDMLRQAERIAGVEAELVVEEAKVRKRRIGETICEVAKEREVDVIVIGSHGAGQTKGLLFGSVSQHVVHHAHCPVLVVRED